MAMTKEQPLAVAMELPPLAAGGDLEVAFDYYEAPLDPPDPLGGALRWVAVEFSRRSS